MPKYIKLIGIALFFTLGLFSLSFPQESITITTYYPSPYGSYNQLYVANNVGIGTTSPYTNKYLTLGNGGQAPIAGAQGIYVDSPLGGGIFMGEADQAAQGKYEVWDGRMGVGTMTNHPVDLWTNNVQRLTVTATGNVGIGTATPGTYKCYINGTGYLNAAAWVYGSDKRMKKNISYLQKGLNIIEQLKPVKFDYIQGEKRQVGFIAQEIEQVLPDIVTKGQDGMLGSKTDSIIPYLVKAIQEQQRQIEGLKAELQRLKKKL